VRGFEKMKTMIPSPVTRRPSFVTDILWDWNGTLLDDTQAALDTLNAMLAKRGAGSIGMGYYRDHFGFPVRPFYEHIGMDLAHEDWDALAREYHEIYSRQPKQLNAGAREALELVKAKGARQSVVSALRQDLLDDDLARFGVGDFMAFAYGTDNLDGSSKLTRAKDLMARLGNPDPRGVVIIGDAFHDKEVADALGIGCILHSQGSHAGWRLRQRAMVADSLPEAVRLAFQK